MRHWILDFMPPALIGFMYTLWLGAEFGGRGVIAVLAVAGSFYLLGCQQTRRWFRRRLDTLELQLLSSVKEVARKQRLKLVCPPKRGPH